MTFNFVLISFVCVIGIICYQRLYYTSLLYA